MFTAIRTASGMTQDMFSTVLNENFIVLENVLDVHKYADIYTFPSVSLGAFASTIQTKVIPHNLGVIPRYATFAEAYSFTNGGTIPAITNKNVIPIYWNTPVIYDTGGTPIASMAYFVSIDETNLYLARTILNPAGSTQVAPEGDVYYYIERSALTEY